MPRGQSHQVGSCPAVGSSQLFFFFLVFLFFVFLFFVFFFLFFGLIWGFNLEVLGGGGGGRWAMGGGGLILGLILVVLGGGCWLWRWCLVGGNC